ncbi:WYL domain-containing protein, partial [Streptomyces sp. T-3]|nr:WYL domain-containing protein [Streptomyces sp. T-3]
GEDRFTREETFDLPGFWAERAVRFARSLLRTEVVVRLSPTGARRLPAVTDGAAAREALDAAGEPDDEGWVTVTLAVEAEEVAYTQLLGLGPEVEVVEPVSLRELFAQAAARMNLHYR